jgi:23S rRNA pseudouridine2605 synthase
LKPANLSRPSQHHRGRVPLERALSKLGLASRTIARKLILRGEVKVNGVIQKDPLFMVTPETAKIEIAGVEKKKEAHRTYLIYKPKGVVVTARDEKGRKTVFDLMGEEGKGLHAVGRLDFATTGLLILTNDTQLSAFLTEPKNQVPRTYIVEVRGEVTDAKLKALQKGVIDEGEKLKPSRVKLLKASGRESRLEVELKEGKNREIRRLFLALGHEVTMLKRIAYGNLKLEKLSSGEFKKLSDDEVRACLWAKAPKT